jgi:two-component system nitrogen regulation response regulator NtrX
MTAKTEKTIDVAFPDLAGANILLIDDEPDIHTIVSTIIDNTGSQLWCAKSLHEAKAASKKTSFDVALVDMVLPDTNGSALIEYLKNAHPDTSLIVITGHADHDMAYTLENAGVRSVLTKPFSASQLRFTLCKEMARRKLLAKEGVLHPQDADISGVGLIGNSAYIKTLRDKIHVFSRGNMPVLIQGPTGTGKEILARAIHRLSNRGEYPMITVNSSAIPEHLEESEFFGHARGAFTGAHEQKAGIIECANGSSLFLDEVGELSLRMQAKLLRALDGNGYTRVGESTPRTADFRLISATNRPLLDMIKEGSFRQDLYFRLKSGAIETQPLSGYKEDIPLLVRHFLYELGLSQKKNFIITSDALDALTRYQWPGNVRELKNVVESLCAINCKSRTITSESIEWLISGIQKETTPLPAPFSEAKTEFEKKFYISLLAKHGGNITSSAKEAGVDRPNFSKKLKAIGIDAGEYKVKKNKDASKN